MQMQHNGWCASFLPGSYRTGAGPAKMPSVLRLIVALLLATVCPCALQSENNTANTGAPAKPPTLPTAPIQAATATPGFTFNASPAALAMVPGGAAEPLSMGAVANAGFHGSVSVKAVNPPAGIRVQPASFTLAPGSNKSIEVSATSAAKSGTYTIDFAATSGTITESSAIKVEVSTAVTTASLSTFFYDFGNDLVGYKLMHTAVVVTNTGKNKLTMNPTLSGNSSYSIATQDSCGATLAAGKSCDMVLRYVPAKASYPKAQNATLQMNFGNAYAGDPGTVAITGVSAALKPGTVSPTNNPQVALYTMTLPFAGRMRVYFGPTESYGLKTWYQSTDENKGQVSIYVAGMKANTTYHMAAQVEMPNGIVTLDSDHTFQVQALPTQWQFNLQATTTAGKTPQPGIEFTNPESPVNGLAAVDLEGNIIWTYTAVDSPGDNLDGAKLLPNGDIALVLSPLSTEPISPPLKTPALYEIREINLAGDTVREISIADLNAELSTATCAECSNLTLLTFHHDVTPLPNGHWIVISNKLVGLSPTTTPPLTNHTPINVLGDVIVDLDENLQPVWAWNEFNHLDPDRHPYLFPDWTHTNAVLYSPSDRNLVISIRHQNWVVKVNYDDGRGNGDIVWRLGDGGDFKLLGGTAPTDWQYAQHGPGFFTPNTSGVFSLGLMDNGDDRLYPTGSKCAPQGALPASCLYSTIPVFKIDETSSPMTAELTFHQKLPADLYSFFGGNTEQLANGHVEYDLCGVQESSYVYEVTQEEKPQTVWSLRLTGGNLYRAFRVPSLYPGVQW
ncbi:MAG: aryl-sulfate sulfotransferase [Terracidiphilus sp.]